jgi:hypothetical protein
LDYLEGEPKMLVDCIAFNVSGYEDKEKYFVIAMEIRIG